MSKALSFTSLLDKKLPTVASYISGNTLPKGGTLLFGGDSKIGKSFLALNMVNSLATGINLYNCNHITCEECKVLLVEQEIGERGLQERGVKIYANSNLEKLGRNFHYVTKVENLLLNKLEGQKILRDLVSEIKPNVLILDPIGKLHTCDENDASEIGSLFTFFDKMKTVNPETDMAVVLTHHFKKMSKDMFGRSGDKLDPHNFRGSNRWFSDPDTIITVQKLQQFVTPTHKWWTVRTRWSLRQEEEPDDMVFSINEKNDCQVRYQYSVDNEEEKVVVKKKPTNNSCVQQKSTQGVMFRP